MQLAMAAGIGLSAAIGVGSLIRYQWQASRNRAQDLAGLKAQESIRDAVYAYYSRFGKWPTGKSDLAPLIKLTKDEMRWIKAWDCRLKSADRSETVLRYSIMVGGTWIDWDAKSPKLLQKISS